MAWTATDVTALEAAILALATGTRVVSVSLSDGKSVQYHQTDLPTLRELLATMTRTVGTQPGSRVASVSKGV